MPGDNKFYGGTSGLVLPVPNKLSYPPHYRDKSRLHYYASLFNSIEVNSSFYKIPMAATVKRWATEVPQSFGFTFKLWRGITHNKGLDFNPDDVQRFMSVIDNAGENKGCLLVQFPASIKFGSLHQVVSLLNTISLYNAAQQWPIAIEFRDRSWYRDEVYEILSQHNIALVLHDIAASATPMVVTATNLMYLRFHGPEAGYRGSYADDFLQEYARYITDWQQEGKTFYAYFNNTLGAAVKNLEELMRMVKFFYEE